MKRLLVVLVASSILSCHDVRRADTATHATAGASPVADVFDNHEQVWRAQEAASGTVAPPHVVVSIESAKDAEWSIWHVRLDANPVLEAAWAMRRTAQSDGTVLLIPHRALVAAPAAAAAFDSQQWTALDACALHGTNSGGHLHASADIAACTAIAPGIGATAALLPISIEHEGEWLRVRLYADQARGADAREDARLVRWFGGWAAVNGGGPKADATSRDWHMNRELRLGSEGGRAPLKWRDGSASGYSLALERLTYRDGDVPVLKLSVIDDASGSTLAYAWANPEATRIGINLGWVQVGLEREGVVEAASK